MTGEEDIVVASVEYDGVVVTCDPPARFRPVIVSWSGAPWWEPLFWGVAENEFLLTPRADALDDLPRAVQSALWNLAVVLDDVMGDPERACLLPPEWSARAASLGRRLRITTRPAGWGPERL